MTQSKAGSTGWRSKGGAARSPGLALLLLAGLACASAPVESIDDFETIPMDRVVPYPSSAELRKRSVEVAMAHRESPTGPSAKLGEAEAWAREKLTRIAEAAGAIVLEAGALKSRAADPMDLGWGSTAGPRSGGADEQGSGVADYFLATRFHAYAYSAEWSPPFRFLWQKPEEVGNKPGTCLHRAEVDLDLEIVDAADQSRIVRRLGLVHAAERESKNLDQTCPWPEQARRELFETAMSEALSCLEQPLTGLLAPRGHVTAHRRRATDGRHLFRISLGRAQGIEAGDRIEIRREQHARRPTGEQTRTERVLVTGAVTDQVETQVSWVAIDPVESAQPLLDGDVVRPVQTEGLLSSLSGPNCRKILTER